MTGQVNKLSGNIAELNRQITEMSGTGSTPNSLLDARNENVRQLNELVGSADGKKFRNYAQQFTLDVLLGYANRHLGELARRYRLERVRDTLALMVVASHSGSILTGALAGLLLGAAVLFGVLATVVMFSAAAIDYLFTAGGDLVAWVEAVLR